MSVAPAAVTGSRASSRAGMPTAVVLGGLVVIAAAFRFYAIGDQSLWLDEIASVYFARQPLSLLWSDWIIRETNPPLYYTLLHFWIGVFGDGETPIRALSAIIGLASIPLTYLLGRSLATPRVGLLAAAVAAVWTPEIVFSQETRGYMLGLAGVQIGLIGLRGMTGAGMRGCAGSTWSKPAPWAYVAGSLVAIYTHTTLFLFPLLANLYFAWWWLRFSRNRASLWAWFVANAVVALGAAWWAMVTLQQLSTTRANFDWIPRPSLLGFALNVWWGDFPHDLGLIGAALAVAVLVLAWRGLRHLDRPASVLVALFGFGAPLALYAVSQVQPVLLPRTVFWTHVPILIAAAAGIAAEADRRRGQFILVAVVVIATIDSFAMHEARGKEPWRELITALNRELTHRDLVVFDTPSIGAILDYYCGKVTCDFAIAAIASGQSATRAGDRWAVDAYRGPSLDAQAARLVISRYDRIIELRRGTLDPNPLLQQMANSLGPLSTGIELPPYIIARRWKPLTTERGS
jgi:uncharacterized membrane protein